MTDPHPAPPAHGGTRPRPYGLLRSPLLRAHGAALAEASFRRNYDTWPELFEQYGERGRQYTAEDNAWHLDFLDASVSRPNTSVRYGPAQAFSKSASERGREADRYKIEEVGQPPRASGAYLNSV